MFLAPIAVRFSFSVNSNTRWFKILRNFNILEHVLNVEKVTNCTLFVSCGWGWNSQLYRCGLRVRGETNPASGHALFSLNLALSVPLLRLSKGLEQGQGQTKVEVNYELIRWVQVIVQPVSSLNRAKRYIVSQLFGSSTYWPVPLWKRLPITHRRKLI